MCGVVLYLTQSCRAAEESNKDRGRNERGPQNLCVSASLRDKKLNEMVRGV